MGEKKILYCKFTQKEDNTITTLIIFFVNACSKHKQI